MRKILGLIIGLALLFGTSACMAGMETQSVPTVAPTKEGQAIIETPTMTVRVENVNVTNCTGPEMMLVGQMGNLGDTMAGVMGGDVTSTSACVAIFNLTHGNRTNIIYIKNGWAYLNLPVDIFTVWEVDTFLVGDPSDLAADSRLVIDEDTMVVDGGITNYYQGQTLLKTVDWSEVSGGVFVRTVRFESERSEFVENERIWTAYCNGNVYQNDQLQEAIECGLNGNAGW